ncbi:MAG TPA: ComEC/Rec2 family competence protein [Bacteroidales bacterium]|nr:ComEC/Rec2 family competence protein [Bacteroidales bacterium]
MPYLHNNFWRQNPLLKIIFPFLLGILTCPEYGKYLPIKLIIILLLIFGFYLLSIFYLYKIYKYKHRWINGIIAFIYFYLTGYIINSLTFTYQRNDYFINNFKKDDYLVVKIKEVGKLKLGKLKFEAEVLLKSEHEKWKKVTGKLLVNCFYDDTNVRPIQYGDLLILNCIPFRVEEPLNPGDFDYKEYLGRKQIFYQANLGTKEFIFINKNNYSIKKSALEIREYFLKIFTNLNLKGDEYSVCSALVLGYDNELSDEIKDIYSATGAMHILSVSGMHVGVVYIMLNFIISLFKVKINIKKVEPLLLISGVWFYALLTGFAPSVFRAAAMLSFVIIAKTLKRNYSIYNSLCASALLILLSDTQLLKNVGFQLSYAAVIGIVLFYESFRKLYLSRFWLPRKMWELVSISLAAQIATAPIAIFYFNQFPNYFILTNLVAAPLSGFIIYIAIATLILSPLKFIGNFCSIILSFLIRILNVSLMYIEQLPYSVTKGLNINIIQCIIIYVIFINVLLIFKTKNKFYVWSIFFLIIGFSLVSLYNDIKIYNQQSIIIFNNNANIIGFYKGKQGIVISDTAYVNKNPYLLKNLLKVYYGLKQVIVIPMNKNFIFFNNKLYKYHSLIVFDNKKILIIDKNIEVNNKIKYKFYIDYLIITNYSQRVQPDNIFSVIKPKMVIFMPKISISYKQKWQRACFKRKINLYDIKVKGAYIDNY